VGRRTNAVLSNEVFSGPPRPMTAKQAKYVEAYLANGGQGGAAAVEAGYAVGSADAASSQLLRNPLIQQAIMRQTLTAIGLSAVPALSVITRLIGEARSDYVKLEAAKDLLDRAGFAAPQRVDHRLDSSLTVSFDFGGSKTQGSVLVTPPDTGNNAQKDAFPTLDVEFSTIQPEQDPDSKGGGGKDMAFPWESEE